MNDAIYDLAAVAAAQCVNLYHHDDPCQRFEALLKVIRAAMELAVKDSRESMLKESRN